MKRLNCRQGENDIRSLFKSDFRGKAGIGTGTPGYKLEVNGTVRSKMVVAEAPSWCKRPLEPFISAPFGLVMSSLHPNSRGSGAGRNSMGNGAWNNGEVFRTPPVEKSICGNNC